jgi:hypothetical protein
LIVLGRAPPRCSQPTAGAAVRHRFAHLRPLRKRLRAIQHSGLLAWLSTAPLARPFLLPSQQTAAAAPDVAANEATLRSAQFTCIYLATKVADQPHAFGLLCFVLTALSGARAPVPREQAADVELRCLAGLGWRLGPFFVEDGLPDGPEDLARLLCWA